MASKAGRTASNRSAGSLIWAARDSGVKAAWYMYSGIEGLLQKAAGCGDGTTSGCRPSPRCPAVAPRAFPGGSGDGCRRGWLGGWVRPGGGAERADGRQKAGEQDGEGDDHEGFGAGGEACSLAEGADGDRRGGPARRAGLECGDADQGDADVAEEGEGLDGGDGAGVNAFEHRRGLGVAESAGDGRSGGGD